MYVNEFVLHQLWLFMSIGIKCYLVNMCCSFVALRSPIIPSLCVAIPLMTTSNKIISFWFVPFQLEVFGTFWNQAVIVCSVDDFVFISFCVFHFGYLRQSGLLYIMPGMLSSGSKKASLCLSSPLSDCGSWLPAPRAKTLTLWDNCSEDFFHHRILQRGIQFRFLLPCWL